MADYIPPLGNLIQFGFFNVTYVEPEASDIEFNWVSAPIAYITPRANVVDFSLRKSPRYVPPLYNVVDFEIKEYSQASSSLYSILDNVRTAFLCIDPIRATLSSFLSNATLAISANRTQAWCGTFVKSLINITCTITGIVPIRITASFVNTLNNCITVITGTHYPQAVLNSTLANVTTSIQGRTPILIQGTISGTLGAATSAIIGRFYHGRLTQTLTSATSTITGIVPLVITGTLSRTLSNLTPVFTAKHYVGVWVKTLLNATYSSTGIVPIRITGNWSSTLASVTITIQSLHAAAQGTFASTFINVFILIRGGAAVPGHLLATLSDVTSLISIRVPIRINATLSQTMGNVVRNVIIGRAWPTGRFIKTLVNLTGTIRGTLPISIIGTLYTNTWALQNPPFFRIFVVPAGNLTRTLTNVSSTIYIKVPVHIYVNLALTTTAIQTAVRLRAAIFAYVNTPTESIYLGWYLSYSKPREGHINAVFWLSGLFYAKVSTHGPLASTFAATTTAIFIRVPIRIFVTANLRTAGVTSALLRGKVAIGGNIAISPASFTSRIYIRCFIGGDLQFTTPDFTTLFSIKVPIHIYATLARVLGNATSYITGRGHHRPVFAGHLASIISNIRLLSWEMFGSMNLTSFNGPTMSVNKFYSANVGEKYPYRSGKYWKLQIFGNNGDQSVTTFKQLSMFKLQDDGELVNVLENVGAAKNFSRSNAEYSSPDGMVLELSFSEDTEIRSYDIEGV